ncbi:MAG: hypothetical protein IJU92_07975 [Spirochaetaceae bacterium]|nr:hypothetical protein [Spirochaetaceae bacterium]
MNIKDMIETFFNTEHILPFMLFLFVFFLGIVLGVLIQKIHSIGIIRKEKQEALKKSRSILKGQIFEQVAPILPNFPVTPKELRFLGSPIDYVAFVADKNNEEVIDEIVFIEVKTGNSNLTPFEYSIKEAIKKKRIRFIEYRIP